MGGRPGPVSRSWLSCALSERARAVAAPSPGRGGAGASSGVRTDRRPGARSASRPRQTLSCGAARPRRRSRRRRRALAVVRAPRRRFGRRALDHGERSEQLGARAAWRHVAQTRRLDAQRGMTRRPPRALRAASAAAARARAARRRLRLGAAELPTSADLVANNPAIYRPSGGLHPCGGGGSGSRAPWARTAAGERRVIRGSTCGGADAGSSRAGLAP